MTTPARPPQPGGFRRPAHPVTEAIRQEQQA